jgi:hypothetical protein
MNDIRSVCYYWENAQKGGTNTIGTRRYKGDVHVWAHCYDAEFDYTSYIKPRKVRSRKEKVVKEPISMAERNLGRKEMEVTNISTGEILVYPSMSEAIRVLGIRQNKIQECMVGKRKSHKGYTFRYTGKCDRAIS